MLVFLLSPNAKDKKVGNTSKLLEPPKARIKIDNDTSGIFMTKETKIDTETK